MSLSEFWASLEQQAAPHVRDEVKRLGWGLIQSTTGNWRAKRFVTEGISPDETLVWAVGPREIVEAIEAREAEFKARQCCEGECPECVTEDSEVAP